MPRAQLSVRLVTMPSGTSPSCKWRLQGRWPHCNQNVPPPPSHTRGDFNTTPPILAIPPGAGAVVPLLLLSSSPDLGPSLPALITPSHNHPHTFSASRTRGCSSCHVVSAALRIVSALARSGEPARSCRTCIAEKARGRGGQGERHGGSTCGRGGSGRGRQALLPGSDDPSPSHPVRKRRTGDYDRVAAEGYCTRPWL